VAFFQHRCTEASAAKKVLLGCASRFAAAVFIERGKTAYGILDWARFAPQNALPSAANVADFVVTAFPNGSKPSAAPA
jgi:hypothetical protein